MTLSWPNHTKIVGGPKARGVWVPPASHLLHGEVKLWAESAGVECTRIPGYWDHDETLRVDVGARPGTHEKVLYYLHGGYYSAFSANPGDLVAKLSRDVLRCSKSITRAFSLEYRRTSGPWDAPVNPFPAALVDAISGFHYLTHDVGFAPENIIIAGDSAGGNLGLALVRYILEARDMKLSDTFRVPSMLILLSPWVDMSVRGHEPNSSVYMNISSDSINMTTPYYALLVHRFVGSLGRHFAETNRFVSPATDSPLAEPVSFDGFPRTLIVSGGAESFLDQIRRLCPKMMKEMGDMVHYHEFADAMHDFIWVPGHGRESAQALNVIGRWVDTA